MLRSAVWSVIFFFFALFDPSICCQTLLCELPCSVGALASVPQNAATADADSHMHRYCSSISSERNQSTYASGYSVGTYVFTTPCKLVPPTCSWFQLGAVTSALLAARKDDATPQEPREFCKLRYTRVIVRHILTPFPKFHIPAQLFSSWMCARNSCKRELKTLKSSYTSTEELSKLSLFLECIPSLYALYRSRAQRARKESELSTQKNTMRQQSREEEKKKRNAETAPGKRTSISIFVLLYSMQ